MLRRGTLVRTDVSDKRSVSIIRVTRIGELGATLAYLATDARCEEKILDLYSTCCIQMCKEHPYTFRLADLQTHLNVFSFYVETTENSQFHQNHSKHKYKLSNAE
jgi:hypothetical protein